MRMLNFVFYSENGQKLPGQPKLKRLYAYRLLGQYYRVQVIDTRLADKTTVRFFA